MATGSDRGGAVLRAHPVEGNVEWGKEAKGTGAADYHDYFEVKVSPDLPLIRSRQIDYGTAGNGAFITNATKCNDPSNQITHLSLEGVNTGTEAEVKNAWKPEQNWRKRNTKRCSVSMNAS